MWVKQKMCEIMIGIRIDAAVVFFFLVVIAQKGGVAMTSVIGSVPATRASVLIDLDRPQILFRTVSTAFDLLKASLIAIRFLQRSTLGKNIYDNLMN